MPPKNEEKPEKEKDEKIDNYFTMNIILMKFTGLYPFDGTGIKILPSILFVLYAAFVQISMLHMVYILVVDAYNEYNGDISAIAFKVANAIAYITGSLTVLFFHVRMPQLINLLDMLNKNLKIRSDVGFDYVTIRGSYENHRKVNRVWMFAVVAGMF